MKKNTSLHKVEQKLRELEERKKNLHTEEYKKLFKDTQELYTKILRNTNFRFSLTDHAVVEYQTDVEFLPPAQAKFNILYAVESYFNLHPQIDIKSLKDVIYRPNIDGIIYVIKNNKVITTYPAD